MNSKSVDVSILIPQYNKPELTVQCVSSLLPHLPQQYYIEVLVIDDGSTEDNIHRVEHALGDKIAIVRHPSNISFSQICNFGAHASTGKYIVFLNNDTVTLSDWITPMLDAFKTDPTIGIVGARLLYPNMTVQHAGIVFLAEGYFPIHPVHVNRGVVHDDPSVLISRSYPAVTGACFMIERELFDAIDGFDERYIFSYEDVDLCLKVIETGRVVWYEANSTLIHLECQTRGEQPENVARDERNIELLNEKWLRRDLFHMNFELPSTGTHHEAPRLFVLNCPRNLRSLYLNLKVIIRNMKSGDKMLLMDRDADEATKQYMVHLSQNNDFITVVKRDELESHSQGDTPLFLLKGYDGFKVLTWNGFEDV